MSLVREIKSIFRMLVQTEQVDQSLFHSHSYHSRAGGCGSYRPVMQRERGIAVQSGVQLIQTQPLLLLLLCVHLQVEPSGCYDNRKSQ